MFPIRWKKMPRKYVKKTNRCYIDEGRMKLAIKDVLTKRLSEYKAAQEYGVKRQTIQSRIKTLLSKKSKEELLRDLDDSGNESEDQAATYSSKYTSRQVFTVIQENELVSYIKRCSDLNYGLNYREIRTLAYEYASATVNNKIPENWRLNKMAGLEWLRGFMKRHKNEISLRKPENTSISRSMAFNRPVVDDFFLKYVSILDRYKFKPEQIWNLDETGLTTVMPPTKVVAPKGKKQVAHISSQERGETVTLVGIVNAAGGAVPPVFVYPRIRNPEEYLGTEFPTSAIALGNKKGWMTSDLFPKVIGHFANYAKCSTENKVLLLVDNHESHISVEAIRMCRERGIVLLSFPPHTTHRMQPLDVGVYGPLKSYLTTAQHDWLLTHPGKVITIRHLAPLTKRAYECAFTIKNITSSFKNTGIWPLNRLIFSDADFVASEVTDKPLVENKHTTDVPVEDIQHQIIQTQSETTPPIPSTSKGQPIPTSPDNSSPSFVTTVNPSLSEIRPFPKMLFENKTKKSRKSKSTIYTDSPEYQNRQRLDEERKRKQSLKLKKKSVKVNLTQVGRNRKISTSSESSIDLPLNESSDEEMFLENMNLICKEDNISVGNFVLVKFLVATSDIYYVAQILSLQDVEYEVKYLRRKRNTNSFLFPEVDDISIIEKKDIAAVLPFSSCQGTLRTSRVFKFNVDFSGFDIR